MHVININLQAAGAARQIVAQIVDFAQKHGVDQATLAERAGVSAEAVSRLKKSGRCRLSTVLALARAAGFEGLFLEPGKRPAAAASIAAAKLSAGRRRAISDRDLVTALGNREPPAAYRSHLVGFFEELPIESVHDVALDEALDHAQLHRLATSLGAEGDTVDWLAEMAGHRVATAA